MSAFSVRTIKELADVLDTTPGAISNWKKRGLAYHPIITKCLQENVSLDYIFGLKNEYEDHIVNDEGETYIKKSSLEERVTNVEFQLVRILELIENL